MSPWKGGMGMNYVTYTDLFAFATFVVCLIGLFLNHKKK